MLPNGLCLLIVENTQVALTSPQRMLNTLTNARATCGMCCYVAKLRRLKLGRGVGAARERGWESNTQDVFERSSQVLVDASSLTSVHQNLSEITNHITCLPTRGSSCRWSVCFRLRFGLIPSGRWGTFSARLDSTRDLHRTCPSRCGVA